MTSGSVSSTNDAQIKYDDDSSETLWGFNGTLPAKDHNCIYPIIAHQADNYPGRLAVHAWDGDLTYSELDELSTALAFRLLTIGVRPETPIPLCLEKSKWTPVAMLGVLKAGGAFTLLDTSQSQVRLQSIISQCNAGFVCASPGMQQLCLGLGAEVVLIGSGLQDKVPVNGSAIPPEPNPDCPMYVCFPPRSITQPRGVIFHHASFCTSRKYQIELFGFHAGSRTFDLASYGSDAAIHFILNTLSVGGCVCIPSESQAMEKLNETLKTMGATIIALTPPFARLLDPDSVPELRTVVLVGEPASPQDIHHLLGRLHIFNAYGQAECTSFSVINGAMRTLDEVANIGRGLGVATWIADVDDHTRLASFGSVGELILEGSTLCQGYLNDTSQTDEDFIHDPSWLLQGIKSQAGRHGRLYRTGDLVYQNPDGSLTYVGPKDTHAKIGGQILNLSKVEHHVRECLPFVSSSVAAEVFQLGGLADNPSLAVFVTQEKIDEKSQIAPGVTQLRVDSDMEDSLSGRLPPFMIPSFYFGISAMPLKASGVLDRRQLREIGASLSTKRLKDWSTIKSGEWQQPETEAEKGLRHLWAQVLNLTEASIGVDNSFFKIGGDSISAMKLVGLARKTGVTLAISDIFKHPILAAQALCQVHAVDKKTQSLAPFSLLSNYGTPSFFHEELSRLSHIDKVHIRDAYPCTPLQEGLLSLTEKGEKEYMMQAVLELKDQVDLASFQAAWDKAARIIPILRTRIVQHGQFGLIQVVCNDYLEWKSCNQLDQYLDEDKMIPMNLGDRLTRFALVGDGQNTPRFFVWTVHHALYDGWSLPLILDVVQGLYHDVRKNNNPNLAVIDDRPSFGSFVKHSIDNIGPTSEAFWKSTLEHGEFASFPALPASVPESVTDLTLVQDVVLGSEIEVTTSTLIRGALGLLISRHTGCSDVLFGAIVSGRNAALAGIEDVIGPTIAAVPLRILVRKDQTVSEYLKILQQQAVEMIPHEQVGLPRIAKISEDCSNACGFQTLLVVQPQDDGIVNGNELGKWQQKSLEENHTTYAMTIECQLRPGAAQLKAIFKPTIIDQWKMEKMLQQLGMIMQQFVNAPIDQTIGGLDSVTEHDKRELWKWNAPIINRIEQCVHHLIGVYAKTQPIAPAICAWDGELRHGELDDLASRLASQLIASGVGPEVIVPLCFEKSMWTIVAMIGVLKAGGAFVLLDPAFPEERLRKLCLQVNATIAVTSVLCQERMSGFVPRTVVLDERIRTTPVSDTPLSNVKVTPANAAYIIFTSGSTGEPKGCIIEHQSYCSAALGHGSVMNMNSNMRTLQYGSYNFAGAIMEILMTLIYGGCVCVPSEEERGVLLGPAICRLQANWAYLTSTTLTYLSPEEVPCLRTVSVGGETVRSSQIKQWASKVQFRQAYGSAETSAVVSSVRLVGSSATSEVGQATTARYWLVDPQDVNQLASIGVPGEIIIEGSVLGRAYIGEPEKTSAVFIQAPTWRVPFGHCDASSRFYKTGDLAAYRSDGSIDFLGRKDTQVKLRGQRIEVGEVEFQARSATPAVKDVAVDLITTGLTQIVELAAFIVIESTNDVTCGQSVVNTETLDEETCTALRAVQQRLENVLPHYMVPSILVPIQKLPLTVSGKTDRRRLRQMGSALSTQELAALRTAIRGQRIQPRTHAERELQLLWAQVLQIDASKIGVDDGFFRLGGDSIDAMKLSVAARKTGKSLPVADIFRHPTLSAQAQVGSDTTVEEQLTAPFSLLPGDELGVKVAQELAFLCHLDESFVEDAYPCTPLQEGLLSLTAKRNGDYVLQTVLKVHDDIELNNLQSAWESVVQSIAVLRTRVVQHRQLGLVQVVCKESIEWQQSEDLSGYLEVDKKAAMALGNPLSRFALICTEPNAPRYLVWTVHHALYDGWSLPLVIDRVNSAYDEVIMGHIDSPIQAQHKEAPFTNFVKYLVENKGADSEAYWKSYLSRIEFVQFPTLPTSLQEPEADATLELFIPPVARNDMTVSTLIRGALAILISDSTGSTDVTFGAVVSGRNAPVARIDEIIGPTLASVPVRVQVPKSASVRSYLEQIQSEASVMIPHEQTGLQMISRISESCRLACGFQTLLVVQPGDEPRVEDAIGTWETSLAQGGFSTYAITLECFLEANSIKLRAGFDTAVIDEWDMSNMLTQLGVLVERLANADPEQKLATIHAMTEEDEDTIWEFNHSVPSRIESTLHDIISQQAHKQPYAPAVCAWDGDLSYGELDELSDRLAYHIARLGVESGVVVPLCFEKSMWPVVAMLAVLKAGGAFTFLDPAAPSERRREILEQTQARLVLTHSADAVSLPSEYSQIVINHDFIANLTFPQDSMPHSNDPCSVAYLFFTSGSTGQPKGVILQNSAVMTSCVSHGARYGIDAKSRVLQFASYTWDACIFEIITTLIHGACICVPSEHERLGNLVGAMNRMEINTAFLTPTVARMIGNELKAGSNDGVPTLDTLILGGEAVRQSDFVLWHKVPHLFNGYGPTEAAIFSVVSCYDKGETTESITRGDIGTAVGCLSWVVDPVDHTKLVPFGSVGELLLEGPILAQGYLNDPDKSRTVFIEDPPWLLKGSQSRTGRSGRLYKTGDLVRYAKNGTLRFVGRKDTQAKIRGQRLELSEVEHHVQKCMPPQSQVIADVIQLGRHKVKEALAVFISLQDSADDCDPNLWIPVFQVAQGVQLMKVNEDMSTALSQQLPSYMMPSIYLMITEVPMTSSGKVDRKKLHDMGPLISAQRLLELQTVATKDKRQPQNERENCLRNIWAQVLNVDSDSIGIDDGFFQVGGDSITAMQVSAAARATIGDISAADILRLKTISRLAAIMKPSKESSSLNMSLFEEHDDQPFPLTPMQQFYTCFEPDPTQSFDQCFLFKLSDPFTFTALQSAMDSIVSQHPMLRARFGRTGPGGSWEQWIVNDIAGSINLSEVQHVPDESEMALTIRLCRESINIETGPLIAAVMFNNSDNQSLFIAIHHLVIDAVSWRIIMQELEDYLRCGKSMLLPSVSFRQWSIMQSDYAAKHLCGDEAEAQHPPVESYWAVSKEANTSGSMSTSHFTLDEATSTGILGKCNEAFGTQPVELLISGLIHSFMTVFSDRPAPNIFSEGHGRESWDDRLDVSRTLGWFTTMWPVDVHPNPDSSDAGLMNIIRRIKDFKRSLSMNGWSYFTSNFADKKSAESGALQFPVEVLFNFIGSFQQLERDKSLFETIPLPQNCDPCSASNLIRFSLFDVVVQANSKSLTVTIIHPKQSLHQDRIAHWIKQYQTSLEQIASILRDRPSEWTLSDLPMALTAYDDVSTFHDYIFTELGITERNQIEDVYPCSSVQQGIIVAQSKNTRNYRTVIDFDFMANKEAVIDVARVKNAWKAVVRRHSLLRAIIADNVPGNNRALLIVLRDPEPTICIEGEGIPALQHGNKDDLEYSRYQRSGLQHHLAIHPVSNQHVILRLDINHAICDGYSCNIIIRDFLLAYNGGLNQNGPLYGDFIRFVESSNQDIDSAFWTSYLDEVEPCLLSVTQSEENIESFLEVDVPELDAGSIHAFCETWDVTSAIVIQLAWALVLQMYTGSQIPCFGVLTAGRNAPIDAVNDIFGPLINVMPFRLQFDSEASVIHLLKQVHEDFISSLPHQTYSLMEIQRALRVGQSGLFNSILSFQRGEEGLIQQQDDYSMQLRGGRDQSEYDISIQASDSNKTLAISLTFKPASISASQAGRIASTLGIAIRSIITNPQSTPGRLSLLGEEDITRIWSWNSKLPLKFDRCLHSLIQDQAELRPSATAICAWDGTFTYQDLDLVSSRLSQHLISMGVGPDVMVPLCFGKSSWMVIAMIAVLKAGGCFVPIDPTQAADRRDRLIKETRACVILTSDIETATVAAPGRSIISVGPETIQMLPTLLTSEDTLEVNPESRAYVIFTSGSTGQPKGVAVQHYSASTSCFHHGQKMGFNEHTRALQFAAYTFDASLIETITTLIFGGCICIPSDVDRLTDIEKSINDMEVNLCFFTPSVSRLVDPEQIPLLRKIIIGGEAPSDDDLLRWVPFVSTFNAYGPTECAIMCSLNEVRDRKGVGSCIGSAVGSNSWLVLPNNHDQLAPIGAVGELLIEGPIVAKGYVNNPEQTSTVFMESPEWLLRGHSKHHGRRGRLYKTGDLVRYNEFGDLIFLGRKDTQVKIRGQRIELGEVEHHVRECIPWAKHIAAEVIQLGGEQGKAMLALFIMGKREETKQPSSSILASVGEAELLKMNEDIETSISQRLPTSMIPSLYFGISEPPLTNSGKMDRKRLRDIGSILSTQQLVELQTKTTGLKRQPHSEQEHQLRQLWAQVLGSNPNSIGVTDGFFRLGGDSITAMKLSAAARKMGITLTVADILSTPVLSAQAQLWKSGTKTERQDLRPFSLFPEDIEIADLQKEISAICNVDESVIEDVYPCTPLQEGLLSLTAKEDGSYLLQAILELSESINLPKLCEAWEAVVRSTEILRTRIIQHHRVGLMQAVCKEAINWKHAEDLEVYLNEDKRLPMGLGDCLSRFALVGSNAGKPQYLIWTAHHALYDGLTLPLVIDLVKQAYQGSSVGNDLEIEQSNFKTFVRYLVEQDKSDAEAYWRSYLAAGELTIFPSMPVSVLEPVANTTLHKTLSLNARTGITTTTMIRGALALLLSRHTSSTDVVFGTVLSGRNAPVENIEKIVGPTIATVPMRVKVRKDQHIEGYLQAIQQDAAVMIAHEQIGLQRIAKINGDCQHACGFQTLLAIHPEDRFQSNDLLGKWTTPALNGFTTYAITLELVLGKDEITIRATIDTRVVGTWRMEKMLEQFGMILEQLAILKADQNLEEVRLVSENDEATLREWNGSKPTVVEKCIHELISDQVVARPHSRALCSWDGDLTYLELDRLSDLLACHLIHLGVGPEVVVPLCFEKSMWTSVALLGVLKAGGAFVLLDPGLPDQRLRMLCHQVKATVALTSLASQAKLSDFIPHTRAICLQFFKSSLPQTPLQEGTPPKPKNAAYIIFTSGSTGEPKGCVIEHQSYASTAIHHEKIVNMKADTRTLQFSSYSFAGAIMELLMTLIFGGCICVPSEEERGTMLAQSIRRLNANWAFLTPTVLANLSPEDVPSLETIGVGGEPVRSSQIKAWSHKVHLRQTYGSAELSGAVSSAHLNESSSPSDVGKAVSGKYWLVNPADPDELAPLGVPGELVIEGPIVGREYIGEPQKTLVNFIPVPKWRAVFGHQDQTSRFYRTGDMAAYKGDGSIELLGRKDTQIKLRGQRIETGEVEYQVRLATQEVKGVAVDLTLIGEDKSRGPELIGFIVLKAKASKSITNDETCAKFDNHTRTIIQKVQARLESVLPHYMVPSTLVPVAKLPLTASGKVDRRLLREMGSALSTKEIAELRTLTVGAKQQPRTESEYKLREIWARVLNLDASSIGVDDSFFQIGGDSITAMQVSAATRATLAGISTADILRKKTISRLLANAKSREDFSGQTFMTDNEENGQPFSLSPMQQLYMQIANPADCFDQSFFLKIQTPVSFDVIATAIETIVARHPMLRARFNRTDNGGWEQRISNDVDSFKIFEITGALASEETCQTQAIRRCRQMINIECGPLLAAVMFNDGNSQSIFISIHHIAVDFVSWRIILQELEELLRFDQTTLPPTLSFKRWCALQKQYAVEHLNTGLAPVYEVPLPLLSYWGVDRNNPPGAISMENFELDKETSAALLGKCNDVFSTRPVELMISALVYSFMNVFTDRSAPAIFSEGHGREPWNNGLDISHTVGWFTTIFPVTSQVTKNSSLLDIVRRTKDFIRQTPANGWSYFTSRFADDDIAKKNAEAFPVEVMFNYAGSFQQLERTDSVFENILPPGSSSLDSLSGLWNFALFGVLAQSDRGILSISMLYPQNLHHQQKISLWASTYQKTLQQLSIILQNQKPQWTIADFPMAFKLYDDISEFADSFLPQLQIASHDEVEDIYPCSPVQQGIIVAQGKDLSLYRTILGIEISTSKQGDAIDLSRITEAWQSVVRRHSLLRALIVDNVPGSGRMMHVILRNPKPSITCVHGKEYSAIEEYYEHNQGLVGYTVNSLQHHLSVYVIDQKRAYLRLEINHAICDGYSTGILLRDFQLAYLGQLDINGPLHSEFIKHIEQQSPESHRRFWVDYLHATEPCCLPSLDEPEIHGSLTIEVPDINSNKMNNCCAEWEVTIASIVQTAWALVLQEYTGSKTPCLGVLTLGRDVPVEDVDDIFGPLICMMPCRIRLDQNKSIVEIVRDVQKEYIESLPHQSYPLMEIHQALGVGTSGFFNSIMSFQRSNGDTETSETDHVIRYRDGQDRAEYDIILNAYSVGNKVGANLDFKENFTSSCQANQIASSLSAAINSILEHPQAEPHDICLLTGKNLEKVWSWNADVPPTVEQSIHELVSEQVSKRPYAPAVCAWDGDLSYRDLEDLSTRLANHLVNLGVNAGSIIPLCFEKSIWTVVAMLAVLKAGGAFVSVDISQAASRRLFILKKTRAFLVLRSSACIDTPLLPENEAFTVNRESIDRLPEVNSSNASFFVNPSSNAYLIFTSGSTGEPKGVMLQHRAVSSSCRSHGVKLGFRPNSRVLQFASYTFDSCIVEIFTTLIHGACVCVPSEDQRSSDLAGIMRSMAVDLAFLTPTVARTLPREDLPFLETLTLCGEAIKKSDYEMWDGHCPVINGYGPTETAVCAVINRSSTTIRRPDIIGNAIGCVSWVVNQASSNKLAPLGAVGELLLEGPTLAQGYLDDAEKTATAFIASPPWLTQGIHSRSGRHGRLYKTGDLVRYNEDGTLSFVGRKDNQVKIHGQRIELGEVEHALQECVPFTSQVVVELAKPVGQSGRLLLAAFLTGAEERMENRSGVLKDVLSVSQDIRLVRMSPATETMLSQLVPGYMIPSAVFWIRSMPLMASGKTDRKRLNEIASLLSKEQIAKLRAFSAEDKRQPRTDEEKLLCEIWAKVLNIEVNAIGIDDSFFHIGGDSITAMQVSAASRASLANISTADILGKKTISKIIAGLKHDKHHSDINAVVGDGDGDQPFQLSPIQQLHMQYQPNPTICFDQGFFLNFRKPVSSAAILEVIDVLVLRHSMLRARFSRNADGIWEQYITNDTASAFHIGEVDSTDRTDPEIAQSIVQCRERIDIEKGPLVSGVLFSGTNNQSLFLSIHHLVIDLVSWRVLLEEMEHLITTGTTSLPQTIQFNTWCKIQRQYVCETFKEKTSVVHGTQQPLLTYWGVAKEENTQGQTLKEQFILDEKLTSAIIGRCNKAFGTRPSELVLSALIYSFIQTFPDRPVPAVFSEGHGREPWDQKIDISRTIGWFTTLFPVSSQCDSESSLFDVIRRTKDHARGLPQNGWSYFTSRFSDAEDAQSNLSALPVEIVFNYTGAFQQLERKDALFDSLALPDGCDPESLKGLRRLSLFDVVVQTENNCLNITVVYPQQARHGERIAAWIEQYQTVLERIAIELHDKAAEWTLSDFPMAFNCYPEILDFLKFRLPELGISREEVENIYPCSPMQKDMLSAQANDAGHYRTILGFEIECSPTDREEDVPKLIKAWKSVVQRHSILRALLVDNKSRNGNLLHVILKDPEPQVSYFEPNDTMTTEQIRLAMSSTTVNYHKDGLQHHLSIYHLEDDRIHVRFEINHAILDGYSTNLLFRDFQLAYSNNLEPNGPSFNEFMKYIGSVAHETSQSFWVHHLDGTHPCYVPGSSDGTSLKESFTVEVPTIEADEIHSFCAKWEVTAASLVQTSWALVLRAFTGSMRPCFGTLTSGRDLPIPQVDEIFGPLINIIPCRINLGETGSVIEALGEVQNEYLQSLPYQTHALEDIEEALHIDEGRLFNSVLSFQRGERESSQSHGWRVVRNDGKNGPAEYDISIGVADFGSSMSITMKFQSDFVSSDHAQQIAGAFSATIHAIIDNPQKSLQDISSHIEIQGEEDSLR